MKFVILVQDKTLVDCNGGSLVLNHHKHALEELGHEAQLYNLNDTWIDCDYIIYQSEWHKHLEDKLRVNLAKKICWVGHFFPDSRYVMPEIGQIRADHYFTQWKGRCVEEAEKQLGKPIFYLPHGYCPKCNHEGNLDRSYPKAVFVGAGYKERSQDWLDYAEVTKVTCPHEKAKDYYKSAIVCPNIHGEFQKNQVTEFTKIPGEMINDRIFNIIMSGGFAVSDNTEIVGEFFNQNEVPRCTIKEEFKWTIDYFIKHPEERLPYMEKARKRIVENYSYVDYYKKFLETL